MGRAWQLNSTRNPRRFVAGTGVAVSKPNGRVDRIRTYRALRERVYRLDVGVATVVRVHDVQHRWAPKELYEIEALSLVELPFLEPLPVPRER